MDKEDCLPVSHTLPLLWACHPFLVYVQNEISYSVYRACLNSLYLCVGCSKSTCPESICHLAIMLNTKNNQQYPKYLSFKFAILRHQIFMTLYWHTTHFYASHNFSQLEKSLHFFQMFFPMCSVTPQPHLNGYLRLLILFNKWTH